jgi:cyanate permease
MPSVYRRIKKKWKVFIYMLLSPLILLFILNLLPKIVERTGISEQIIMLIAGLSVIFAPLLFLGNIKYQALADVPSILMGEN